MATVFPSHRDRASIARRGNYLEILTIAWAIFESAVALISSERSGSISLAGFGLDSLIEVVSGVALMWRMSHEMDAHRRHQAEHISLRIAGWCLLGLAAYVAGEAIFNLVLHRIQETSWTGIAITTAAVIFMPLLSRAKRSVGKALDSAAMMTDARQTDFCMYQAAIVLFGLVVHALFGITWTDSVAALVMVPFLLRAGILSLKGEACCGHHAHRDHHQHEVQAT
jgi:divalent metal cation (Fe/Co/Zn/Cd) transporter